jgi:hypothetical protein
MFSSELEDALSNIIHSSTLKTLSLTGITEVPITFFLHIVHLSTLELGSFLPNDFGGENSSSLTQAALKRVAPMASESHILIDRCVWHSSLEEHIRSTRFPSSAYFSLIQDIESPTQSIFLPFMCRLRFFEIYIDLGCANTRRDFNILSSLIGSLCISLTYPATLEHLDFNIRFCGFNYFNYYAFDFNIFYENLRNPNVWSHLGSLTTHPTGSRLQRVGINIEYDDDLEKPDENELLKAIYDGLPLLRTKGILFVKFASHDSE